MERGGWKSLKVLPISKYIATQFLLIGFGDGNFTVTIFFEFGI